MSDNECCVEPEVEMEQVDGQGADAANGFERKYDLPEKRPDPQKYGIKENPEEKALDAINQEIMEDERYKDVENLTWQLEVFKGKFLEFEKDKQGNIDLFGLKRMMEKLGQAKTHLEIKKMISEIDSTNSGTICYRDFVMMMIGPKSSILKLYWGQYKKEMFKTMILMFEQKGKEKEKPTGVAPKRNLADLP
ncbi:allograft inflammatory factor 1-like isoform X1 [Dreissena polymorpha]|nr:allograft inflammatory factor 1-like isoform X1 [Dreissena polymorpha]XP_052243656.1 allograft inflammatory factor 1-like isoform X1 [Dreissena polymorpha]XP_052243657.1 allograft inflammatory factor 1-like isoform X1 [Dreissena polymorpha]XP_052243658.1 allograft inflammatory factor 1-like isoform X1 [Dreissena polymorpha]XP_052243659.1 allograft inflammatory factor 1-like isoform X1 [Dreissena polymorpha]XP_052243660.1 allograft inflammatory factor 1-like isoform X1 [Dreissena polymorpha]